MRHYATLSTCALENILCFDAGIKVSEYDFESNSEGSSQNLKTFMENDVTEYVPGKHGKY